MDFTTGSWRYQLGTKDNSQNSPHEEEGQEDCHADFV